MFVTQSAAMNAVEQTRMPRGVVILYSPNELYGCRHEQATHVEAARRLAGLKGFDFAGEYDPLALN